MTLPSPVPDPPLQLNDEASQREELVAEIKRLKEEKARAVEAQFFFLGISADSDGCRLGWVDGSLRMFLVNVSIGVVVITCLINGGFIGVS